MFNNHAYSNISFNNELKKANLSLKDQQFAARIVYGSIQNKLFLEYQLDSLLKKKLKDKFLKPLLLLSLYQIQFMTRVPARAAIDEANKLAKKYSGRHSGSFKLVNGILRTYQRRGPILPDKKEQTAFLSVKYSIPEWLVRLLENDYGKKRALSIISSLNQPAKNSIRLRKGSNYNHIITQLKQSGYGVQESKLSKNNLILSRGGIMGSSLFKTGMITIQDESASLVTELFNLTGKERILDACAAPGGKTMQLAERLATGQVVALDIHQNKTKLIEAYVKRMHLSQRVTTKALDARKAVDEFGQDSFAAILVDAPCSGLGLLRRKPEIRYEKTWKDIENLQRVQLEILNSVVAALKPGGQLVYSTCSISLAENEEVIKKFLAQNPNFKLQPFKLRKIESKSGMLKILPDEYMSDGFFMAKLEKNEVDRD